MPVIPEISLTAKSTLVLSKLTSLHLFRRRRAPRAPVAIVSIQSTLMFPVLTIFCAISFIGYGVACLTTDHMVREFARYGLPGYRKLTGFLQLLAAVGLIVGFKMPMVGAVAAGGLALQMLVGLGVRLKIRDSLPRCLPALVYLCLSAWICLRFVR